MSDQNLDDDPTAGMTSMAGRESMADMADMAAEARVDLWADPASGVAFARRMWDDDVASRGLGMEAVVLEQDHAVVRMPVRPDMVNGHDICHGGFIFTLADSCFALACNSRGRTTVAAGADIAFTAPGRLGDVLVADARVRAAYGRSGITDVTVRRESDGQIIAEFRGRSRSLKHPSPSTP
ncbi:aromatic compound degradation protein PaaI [Intrasporangium oryzae NRRL B-24470]|uniref:Aromatic compound degradation protein PaaI n=1 Tax=Intrasporangium oryzae NRRL B-24470 TaxID=1386089 RepID=W9G845_9MICO|nr:hydroxyphenylacetyl-CoA thioesterase PaaI [Intrasporangium oryzae]EWT00004.1 aromatic compound degradation protein PaaI [Intrasporangium oryzae NRRL B-24470]